MPRNAAQWNRTPPLPPTHYVDPLVYTSEEILAQERDKIFARAWSIACHESEVPERYDYRTYRHPAGKNLVVVRGDDGTIRTFFNVCPHRGNTILYNPAGNAKHLLCIFHAFAFDCRGDCVAIPREKAGYQERIGKGDFGLRAVRTEVGFGGFVFVNLDDRAPALETFIGEALDGMRASLEAEPLEVFTFHRAIVRTNYKLWHDTNSEFYHDYMHYHNRQTSMAAPGYFERRYTAFPNGHAQVSRLALRTEPMRLPSQRISRRRCPRRGKGSVAVRSGCSRFSGCHHRRALCGAHWREQKRLPDLRRGCGRRRGFQGSEL